MATSILLYYGYTGSFNFVNATGVETLNLSFALLLLSIVAWIATLNLINIVLVRKIYHASLEEGRIM